MTMPKKGFRSKNKQDLGSDAFVHLQDGDNRATTGHEVSGSLAGSTVDTEIQRDTIGVQRDIEVRTEPAHSMP